MRECKADDCEWARRKTKLEIYAALVGWSMAEASLSGKLREKSLCIHLPD